MKKEIKFQIPSNENLRFLDPSNNKEYIRTFALWKCVKCNKRWHSAYTWLSLNFLVNNNKLFKDKKKSFKKESDNNIQRYIGPNLKVSKSFVITNDEYLNQHCKSCTNINNQIIYYSELRKGLMDTRKPHLSESCAKCLRGYPCMANNKRFFT